MEHSFSKVRCSSAAFLLAAGIALAACGDDGGGTTPTPSSDAGLDSGGSNPNHDGGSSDGGAIDGGAMDGAIKPTPDAGAPDASTAELAAALDPSGVHVSDRRAELVYTASCARGKECGSPDGLDPMCASSAIASYQRGVAAHYSDACLDSSLDLYGCLVTLPCDDFQSATGCSALADAFSNNCGAYESDAGGP